MKTMNCDKIFLILDEFEHKFAQISKIRIKLEKLQDI